MWATLVSDHPRPRPTSARLLEHHCAISERKRVDWVGAGVSGRNRMNRTIGISLGGLILLIVIVAILF
jgi:hypothetical protein